MRLRLEMALLRNRDVYVILVSDQADPQEADALIRVARLDAGTAERAIRAVSDLFVYPRLIGFGYWDIHALCRGRELHFACGSALGKDRQMRAVEDAIAALQIRSLAKADAVLVSVGSGGSMTLDEVDHAINRVRNLLPRHCDLVCGNFVDVTLGDEMHVSILAGGAMRSANE